ncbi:MAG: alpha-D-ribose 1-methylphosphonate 5-triphosphate diphosphatase, partial [Aestuariivita sp.]
MAALSLSFCGAEVLRPDGLSTAPLHLAEGQIVDRQMPKQVDLSGFLVLPGIVDIHGDGFERHLAPRRGAMKERSEGLVAAEAEFASNGITTAVLAQFYSWEGGLRGPEFADSVLSALAETRASLVTDLHGQLRFETHMLDEFADLPAKLKRWGVSYV